MYKKSLKIIVTILAMNSLLSVLSFAQVNQKIVTVKDEGGNPVSGAVVLVGEGAQAVRTNDIGEFSMPEGIATSLFIEAEGFESQLIDASITQGLVNLVLIKAPFQMGERDRVNVPFGSLTKREIPGAVTVLSPRELLNYDNTTVRGALNGRVPGMFGSSSIRGMGDPLIVIDGIPRQSTDLDLQQIEQITVLKDISTAMLYGSQASNGVILITTKRGEPLKKALHFTAENGFSKPISYPQYLDAATYMELYNEALSNDGLAPKYSSNQISNTRSGTDPVQYPNEEYFNSTYLKDWSTYQHVVGEASGGNEIAQYYLNLGWDRNNSLLKLGEGANEKTDRLKMRGNINYKLNDVISLRYDGAVVFNISNGPRYKGDDFWNLASTLHPEYYPVLIPADLMTDPTLAGAAKLVDGQYLLGGTSEYLTNIYGELTRNGPSKTNERLIQISTGLDFDLSSLAEGLKASTYFSFDMYNSFSTDILNSYAVYHPSYAGDTVAFSKYGVDAKLDEQSVSDVFFYRRTGIYGTLDYVKAIGDHEIKATGLAYREQYTVEDLLQPTKHLNFGVRANYSYQNKVFAELTGVVAGSSKLFETQPYAFSPGVGLGWILSEESFLKDNPVISYLKIRANWAINNTDEAISSSYLGRDFYYEDNTFLYNHRLYDNTSRLLSTGNPDLRWEKLMNINAGFESMLLDYKLGFELSYFYNKSYDLISQRLSAIPGYFTSLPYENYGSNLIQGVETGLNYRLEIGDMEIKLGANLVYSIPKVLVIDELNYPDEYRKQTGKPTDAIFGFVAQGLFRDQTEIESAPTQNFGTVQPGDIRYEDLNQDGVINNDDQKMIGNSGARIGYGLTLNIRYRSLELFALGTGQSGQSSIFNNPYYWVYGNRKYSGEVLGRWTPGTAATATYPRLSSTSNANNFINSTYWLYENRWFNLQTVQVTYTLQAGNFAGLDQVQIFLRGNNLLKISEIKDRTDLNIGSSPQVRAFSIGLKMLF